MEQKEIQEAAIKNRIRNIILTILIFSVCIVIICLPVIIQNIKFYIAKKEFSSQIDEYTINKYEYCSSKTINGKYNCSIKINMNENFNNLDYEEQEKIIIEITNSINSKFQDYLDECEQIKDSIELIHASCKTLVYCNDDYYEYDIVTGKMQKNGNRYNLEMNLKENILDNINDENYQVYLGNITDINSLKEILSIKDLNECKNEILYLSAVKSYSDGNFEDTINKLNKIDSEYKKKKEYLRKTELAQKIQGTYRYLYIHLIVIDKWNITFGIDPKYNTDNFRDEVTFNYTIKDNEIALTRERTTKEIIDGICEKYKINTKNKTISNDNKIYKYESADTNFPEKLKKPTIGMTKVQAENSTWGKPIRINKTTTSYGVHEQWVYYGNRYLYFDNGLLTSIQE